MSCIIIKDGAGTGNQTKVDDNKRLHVDASSRNQDQQAALLGNSYNINTGSITLTSDSESAVLYIKYTGEKSFIIKEILGIITNSTGGTGEASMSIIKNPSTGTIISGASDVDTNENRDFSSANIIDGVAYKGAEGNTLTNGSVFASTTRTAFTAPIAFDASIIVLRKGNSIGVKFTPPSGNTSQSIKVAVTCFESETDVA